MGNKIFDKIIQIYYDNNSNNNFINDFNDDALAKKIV